MRSLRQPGLTDVPAQGEAVGRDEIRHPSLVIVQRILEALLRKDAPTRTTPLQLASGLNYSQITRYLPYLRRLGTLTLTKDRRGASWIELTDHGRDVAGMLARLSGELNSRGPALGQDALGASLKGGASRSRR